MKRDMDLVRYILLKVESADRPIWVSELVCDMWPKNVVTYHLEMMDAHGLIDGHAFKAAGDVTVKYRVDVITWDGYDFLDSIRDDGVYEKTKRVISDTVSSVTLDTFKEVAKMIAIGMIKSAIGM